MCSQDKALKVETSQTDVKSAPAPRLGSPSVHSALGSWTDRPHDRRRQWKRRVVLALHLRSKFPR
eukprot:3536500-Rhodomonas_salina.1